MRIKKSLAEYTADALGEQIVVQKKYKTGDQLPNEIELAREFGVSRATLREAIRVLAVQGLLTVERGRGTFVNSEVKNYKDVQFGDIGSLRMKLIDLFELRRIFETEAVRMACERGTEEEIRDILDAGARVAACINRRVDRTVEDQRFHHAIAIASHNEFMVHLVPMVYRAVSETLLRFGTDEILARGTLNDHALIMEGLERRDPELARNAMYIHMAHAIVSLRAANVGEEIV